MNGHFRSTVERRRAGGYREHDVLVIHDDETVENITGYPYGPDHNIVG